MSKILRLLTVSLLLASIMIATVAGGVFAKDQTKDQTRDCLHDCCDFDPGGLGPNWDRE